MMRKLCPDAKQLKLCFAFATSVLAASSAVGATLPLIDGEYTRGKCAGVPDIMESIGLYTTTDGVQKGQRSLSPNGDGQGGYCALGRINVAGANFSGSAECRSGTRIDTYEGTYRFSYQILNNRTFISKGKKYVWCSAGR